MLFPDKKNYNSSMMISTEYFHAAFVIFNKKYCKPYEFIRIVSLYNKKIKERMMNTGELIELPYIGKFGFQYVTPEDDFKVFGTPRINDSKKAEYWLSQDDEHYHEIDNVQFYTDQPRLISIWFRPKSWVKMKRHCSKCFVLKMSRDIQRNATARFKNNTLCFYKFNFA